MHSIYWSLLSTLSTAKVVTYMGRPKHTKQHLHAE